MPEAGCDDEVDHGDHAVQLGLVHGDAGVDGILTCTVQYSTIQYRQGYGGHTTQHSKKLLNIQY